MQKSTGSAESILSCMNILVVKLLIVIAVVLFECFRILRYENVLYDQVSKI